ncbi:MAG: YraN family protein [SAR86 cluster bacterium]|uniref:UPF0102 protein COC19_02685 n=1 Tax=SAR86 cluster bacterium TaxID=2030880 RepID=A0A2A4MRQ2_9GAMM|nr:MAG: YraN family protein [SAR86 cluster bacterium]
MKAKLNSVGFGKLQELVATEFLQLKGLKHYKSNYRCRLGEIDLIMFDSQHLVFVEVRYRSNTNFASPLESVNYTKQCKLRRCAQHFLMMHTQFQQFNCRFDVIGISPSKHNLNPEIEWIENAF